MKTNLLILLIILPFLGIAQVEPSDYQDMEYRCIGPFRASRTVGAVGIPDQPNVFFVGINNGGVWKTDDYGRTWNPIFDDAPTGSIGDLAVSPSHPDIIYVGTGEGLHRPDLAVGDGMFKSTDGGKTWNHIGLGDIQQIGRVIIHPTNPDIVIVAGLGHPYGANEMRGVFKTVDGGKSWEKVLYINENTGAIQVEFDPSNPNIIFADMWEHQEGPWENARFSGPNSGLYRSNDGGNSWTKLTKGLPTAEDGLGRIGVGISPSNPKRMYATVDARNKGGVYRSDDGGDSWKLVHTNRRVWGRGGDFGEIRVHPNNPDVVFAGNVASYKSTDGGYNFFSIKGAPGGDDYHRIWINPKQPDIMLFAADQGATITVNGGKTWSSWYNQPTSQLYHVSTDNQFPYWVYGGQQESGAIGTASRGAGGQISFRDWIGVGSDEYAYVAPDPKDPNIIYGGRVTKYNKLTGQSQNVSPEVLRSGDVRFLRTMPLMFHPANDNMLLFATNYLWKTLDGGNKWEKISPDLTREKPDIPSSVGNFKTPKMENMRRRAIIYAIAPSSLDENIIWAGTDDGLVHVTTDGGKSWNDVTPPQLTSWDKVSQIDAGHFDKNTAYIAINAIRKNNMTPLVYKTHDMGKSWQLVNKGMNPMGPVNVVREDPKVKNLIYAGTEREVYFSPNDGDHWYNLRLNMPASSIRDFVIHDNDLVVGTHGRSIWILDDLNPVRMIAKSYNKEMANLYPPNTAIRVRDNLFHDTPLPPEEPAGQNPPDGAIIDYWLPKSSNHITIEILDKEDQLIRTYDSQAALPKIDTTSLPHPTYWIRPEQEIGTSAGHHRIVWDLRHDPPEGARRSFPISAVKNRTPHGPLGHYVLPGSYTVRMKVNDQTFDQEIKVKMDPRVTTSSADLTSQYQYSSRMYDLYHKLQEWRNHIDQNIDNPSETVLKFRGSGSPRDGDFMYGSIRESKLENESIVSLQNKCLYMLNLLQSADAAPTNASRKAVEQLEARYAEMQSIYDRIK